MHSAGQISDTAHPTTNRSCRGINSLVPPRTLNLQLFLDGVRPDIIVAEIFQHLGTRISFQVKENSIQSKLHSTFIQIQSSTWHLPQDALNRSLSSLDNLPLRREDPFLLKINHEAFHFKFQPENLHLTPKFFSIFFLKY